MILLDILFYILYSTFNRTNKSIPEWSTATAISLLFSFNLFSLLFFFNVPIKKIGENKFMLIPLLLFLVNWMFFLKNKRYLKIIKKYSSDKLNYVFSIIVIIYTLLTIVFLFISLKLDTEHLITFILPITLIALFAHITGNTTKDDDINNKSNDID